MELLDCPQCGMKHPPLLPGQTICPNAAPKGRKGEVIQKFMIHYQNLLETRITEANASQMEKKLSIILKILHEKL